MITNNSLKLILDEKNNEIKELKDFLLLQNQRNVDLQKTITNIFKLPRMPYSITILESKELDECIEVNIDGGNKKLFKVIPYSNEVKDVKD